jgi:hypothetical protein
MAETRAVRRLAAILAADIVGYSRLMGIDEEATLAALKACRRERATLPEKASIYWFFCVRSGTSVRVWLRRFIGYLSVERKPAVGGFE